MIQTFNKAGVYSLSIVLVLEHNFKEESVSTNHWITGAQETGNSYRYLS